MEQLQYYLSLGGSVLGLLITALTFLVKFVQNAKAKRTAQNMLDLSNAIMPYIEQAEAFAAYSGQEKKEYVMTKVNQYAIDNKIRFNAQQVCEKIEEIVSVTKKVNTMSKIKQPELQTFGISAQANRTY